MPLNNENNNDCCKCTTPQYELTLNQQGPQGKTGPQGLPGFSPTIVVNTNTDRVYSLTINTIDGQIVTPNLKASVPGDGAAGYVLTKNTSTPYDMSFQAIPQATETQSGILQLATITDTQPDSEGEVDDTKAVTPDVLVDYVNQEIGNIDYSNFVTLNTQQTISGLKTFSNDTGILTNSIKEIENGSTIITYNTDASNILIGSTGNNTTNITLRTSENGTLKYAKGPNDTYNIITSNDIATTSKAGIVKPDGTTITIDADGTIHSVDEGTEDYNELENLPQINGVELKGNLTSDDLNISTSITDINGGGAESTDYITYYTVVGNPTISDDFVLTNTGNSNYVDTGYTASGFNSIEISLDVLFTDFNSTYYFTGQIDSHNYTCPQLASGTDRTLNLACSNNGSSWIYLHNTDVVLDLNTRYNLRVGWKNETKKWYGFLTNVSTGVETNLGEVDCTQPPLFSYPLEICYDQGKPTYMQTGLTMYLDTFKITKNGQLDYQAVQIL